MLAPTLHVQTPAQFPASKVGCYLWGYVRTDVPGYRELQLGDTLVRIPSGTYRWDALIAALAVQLLTHPTPWPCALTATGLVYLGNSDIAALTFPDRLGWLLGFGAEAGVTLAAAEEHFGRFIPPGGFPLVGADWDDVTTDREVRAAVDLQRRGSGSAWGSARLWRTTLTMSRWHYEALCAGWLLHGRIAIVPVGYESTAMSSSQPKGHIDGYVVSPPRARWLDPLERFVEVTMIVATAAT